MQLRRIDLLAIGLGVLLLQGALAAPRARAQSPGPGPGLPNPGMVLMAPSLSQLRPLVGRVVRITLRDGKQLNAKILSAWPGVVRVAFADGRTAAIARHRIRSVTYLGPRFLSLAAQDAADSSKTFTYLGLGLTLGGLVLGGAVAPPLYVLGEHQQCPGLLDCVPAATTAAIFITALSASALAAGVPLWIAGVVRRKVHARTGPAAARSRHLFRVWGMGLTVAGTGLAAVGSALLGASAFAGVADHQTALRWAGAITAPLGVFVALCMGLPMWMEAIRKAPNATPNPNLMSASSPRGPQDPHAQKAWTTRHPPTPPATTFGYGWQF